MISTMELCYYVFGFLHPERMKITQPRVARSELPWVKISRFPTLKELKPADNPRASNLIQPLQGWADGNSTQGRHWCANPGLSDHNPVGVAERNDFVLTGPRQFPP